MSLIQQATLVVGAIFAALAAVFSLGANHRKNQEKQEIIDDILQTQERQNKRKTISYADKLKWLFKYDKS